MAILIVDHDNQNIILLKKALHDIGYNETIESSSRLGTFELLKQHYQNIDLILLNIMMPNIDGVQLCQKIYTNEKYNDIPIIIMTTSSENEFIEDAFEAGATDYITKPINIVELKTRVKLVLRIKKETDERKKRENQIDRDLQLAKTIQKSVLSPTLHDDHIQINGVYLPSEHIGGDMYCWFKIDHHRYGIMLIDVMGHGIASALISMSVRALLRGMITRLKDPELVIPELNKHVHNLFMNESWVSYYLTCFYIVVDTMTETIEYANAGHPKGFLMNKDKIVSLEQTTVFLGMFPSVPVNKQTLKYEKNSKIILYTDGLIDALQIPLLKNDGAVFYDYLVEDNHALLEKLVTSNQLQHRKYGDDVCIVSVSV
ncbi:MAG TPA: fused response regulator/phosphatase [Bacillus bacterium]|nr:fused response regulator/phosphatase [Bacillus sp. (in: firmicutes)]